MTASLVDPSTSASGEFGGGAVALRIDIDFYDANVVAGTAGLHFGDLTLCGFTALPSLNRVRQFMGVVNTALGGGSISASSTEQPSHTLCVVMSPNRKPGRSSSSGIVMRAPWRIGYVSRWRATSLRTSSLRMRPLSQRSIHHSVIARVAWAGFSGGIR
jgi:hypothetical protein